MTDHGKVLVTGGSGFIGGWCVIRLLQQGYAVRTTIRNLAREGAVRAALGTVVEAGDRLDFFAAELTADAGWDEATSGCDYVLHVASPVMVSEPSNPDVLIKPASGISGRRLFDRKPLAVCQFRLFDHIVGNVCSSW